MGLNNEYLINGEFGLERETLRVTAEGKMAETPHPFQEDKYFERDFCENQLELITPVCEGSAELMSTLANMDKRVKEALLRQDEFLWMYSNPPRIETETDIPIARYTGDKSPKYDYRVRLSERYGKRLMLYSGIHLNISFPEKWLRAACDKEDYGELKNKLYFTLLKQALRHSWLLVLLTAASPVYDKSLDGDCLSGDGHDGFASRRNSKKGYWNNFTPILDFTDIHTYTAGVREYIRSGALLSESELYVPVRIKPRGVNSLDALLKNGANHIELRMFDVNPLSPVGIFKEDIDFSYYLMLYLLSLGDFDFTPEMQAAAMEKHKNAAKCNADKAITDEAIGILDAMAEHFKDFNFVTENIALQKSKLISDSRYCVRVYEKYHEGYQEKMLQTSKDYARL